MQYSTYNVSSTNGLKVANNVEYCNCPNAYTGQYCQECSLGHTRSPPNGGEYDQCLPCQCNGHSSVCDTKNGTCFNCLHNTEGEKSLQFVVTIIVITIIIANFFCL